MQYAPVEVQALVDNAVAEAIAETRESMIQEEIFRINKESERLRVQLDELDKY
jgi:hypothetical protein